MMSGLELEPRLARGLGERTDAPVIHEAGAVESDLDDALGLGALGDRAAHGLGGLDVAGDLELAAHLLLNGGGGDQHLVAFGGEDLGVDVLRGAMHRQAQRRELADLRAAAHRATQPGVFLGDLHDYFFFASFSEIFSSAYFTPLPL